MITLVVLGGGTEYTQTKVASPKYGTVTSSYLKAIIHIYVILIVIVFSNTPATRLSKSFFSDQYPPIFESQVCPTSLILIPILGGCLTTVSFVREVTLTSKTAKSCRHRSQMLSLSSKTFLAIKEWHSSPTSSPCCTELRVPVLRSGDQFYTSTPYLCKSFL